MMRSLFSGVSGLRNHQTRMDVIGNNIANVNTTAFKGGRVNFQDVMSQTLQSATAAQGSRGGTNPMQIGMGMGVAAIDTNWNDGTAQTTGRTTDLAIQGQGFFSVTDGVNDFYTRAGSFDFDTSGNLITGSGNKVLGYTTDSYGNVQSTIATIQVPSSAIMPGEETSILTFAQNLSADAPVGTTKQTTSPVYDSQGKKHDATVVFTKIGDNQWLYRFAAEDGAVLPETQLGQVDFNAEGILTGVKTIRPLAADVTTPLSVNIPMLKMDSKPDSVNYASFCVYDAAGEPRVLSAKFTNLTPTTWEVQVTEPAVSNSTILATDNVTYTPGTGLYTFDGAGTPFVTGFAIDAVPNTVTIPNPVASAPPDESEFRCNATSKFQPTTDVDISAVLLDSTSGSSYDKYITVFDENITPRVFKMNIVNTGTDTWDYTITESGVSNATPVGQGQLNYYAGSTCYGFGSATTLATSFTFETDGANQTVSLNLPAVGAVPAAGAPTLICSTFQLTEDQEKVNFISDDGRAALPISMMLDDITQTSTGSSAESSLTINLQNGYAPGTLTNRTFDSSGNLIGTFSNGRNRTMAQLALYTFSNPGGLTKEGDTLFLESSNSGMSQAGKPGVGSYGTIRSGALEMSNVDLAQEFSNMIVTQRGYQTNSKIISVADEMLQELVNLKR